MRLLPPRKRKRADRARRAGPPLRLCFLQRWGAEDSCSAGLPSHLRRFPLKYKTWLAPAESINPKRDRLVESHLSKNETEIQDLVSTRRIHKSQAGSARGIPPFNTRNGGP